MYRLLSLRKIKIRQLNDMTIPNNVINSRLNVNERACTLCKQWPGFPSASVRHQSTNANPIVKPARKKRLRGVKKYADVLVITDKSISEHKTKIRKLTSEDLNFLAITNLNLGELYKLKKMMDTNKVFEERTYNNLTIIETPPSIETASGTISIPTKPVIMPSVNIESNIHSVVNNSENFNVNVRKSFEKKPLREDKKVDNISSSGILGELDTFQTIIPAANAFQPEIVDEDPQEIVEAAEDAKSILRKRNELEAKKEIISRTLAAYIEICSVFGIYNKGLGALHAYKSRVLNKRNTNCDPITNINVYNAALKGAATIGDLKNLKDIFKYAKSLSVVFNVQSYGAIFECLGRNTSKNTRDINFYTNEAIANGFTFDRIMNEGMFSNDERVQVLNTMRAYNENYIPKYIPPNVQYNNPLLDNLNKDGQCNYQSKNSELSTGIFTKEKMRTFIQDQIKIEKTGYITVQSIEKRYEPTVEILKCRASVEEHLETWKSVAEKAFERDMASLASKKQSAKLEPYIKSIPMEDVVNIMIDEAKLIAQGSETYSPTVNQLYRELGNKVYARYNILRKEKTEVLDKIMKIHTRYCDDFVSCHNELDVLPKEPQYFNTRQMWQGIEFDEKPNGSSVELDHQPWVPSVLISVGKFLYHIIMHDLKVDSHVMKAGNKPKNFVAAFYTIFRHQGRIIKEEVKPHPILSKLYRASEPETLTFPTNQVPMKCPPIPWSTLAVGGYLVIPTDFVRLPPQALTQRQRLQAASPQQLYPSYDALNQLAAVPWQVNKKILSVILDVFIKGGSAKLTVPEHPATLPIPVSPSGNLDKQEKFQIFRQRLQYRRKKAEMYSLWCDCLYRLSLANHFKDDVFWLPHNMDFRGRVYPIPPHLNHLGSDLARSMLVFAESRPLGPNGLDWLKIHLVNLTGMKKRDSIVDRLTFANEIMDKILDSADNPLTGKMWWAQSDEPWQTLACCMEIAVASRSPDPENYRSHFPVHQDGSCNGLQHYAALGRDSAGGHSVNLTPASKPQDVYSAVASLVEERRHQDAENGIEIAKVLKNFVRRKVIKQTVMTTVYGVTRFGARLQIARQLKDIDDFPKESVWAGSSYLTTRTFESLRTMFTSTREIQDWFTECARLISSVCCENVEWVTPLGLPIVQPYFKFKVLPTNMHFEPFHMDKYERPNVMKQKNAFPPNFIHSLDSSHMMLTSLHCERAGITFVSVHDCYWTHPSTVHIMNKICREQFVALHSEPILEELSLFLSEKYSYSSEDLPYDGSVSDLAKRKLNKVLKKLPKTGNFNIENVLDSVYFFS